MENLKHLTLIWFMHPHKPLILLISCLLSFPALAAPAAELAAPHRAIYDVDMIATRSGAQVVDVHGKMFYEWTHSCDAWITNHRFNLVYEYADSPGMRIASDFNTYELRDGSAFHFSSRRSRDGQLYEDIRGHADLSEAIFTSPVEAHYDMPDGVMFPSAHTLEMIRAAQKGTMFFSAPVFDGSDEEGPIEINTFIGKRVNPLESIQPSKKLDMSLLNTPAYRVRMAVFPLRSDEEESDYEMSMIFHDNGVISDMVIDYDDFSVRQTLVGLEKLEPRPCVAHKKSANKAKSR